MEIIKCGNDHLEMVTKLYHDTVKFLKENINYPKWSSEHPSDLNTAEAIRNGQQYVCMDNNRAVGTFAVSENPEGFYEAGDWSCDLKRGEYLVIHTLASDPFCMRKGVGIYMVEKCISIAKGGGYKAIRLDVVPGNIPAERLYKKMGFTYAGTKDLQRDIEEIPVFDLYELCFDM